MRICNTTWKHTYQIGWGSLFFLSWTLQVWVSSNQIEEKGYWMNSYSKSLETTGILLGSHGEWESVCAPLKRYLHSLIWCLPFYLSVFCTFVCCVLCSVLLATNSTVLTILAKWNSPQFANLSYLFSVYNMILLKKSVYESFVPTKRSKFLVRCF